MERFAKRSKMAGTKGQDLTIVAFRVLDGFVLFSL